MKIKSKMSKVKKIPILIGLFLPIITLLSGILLIDKARTVFSSANSGKQPQQVRVSNITDTSFVVTWNTEENTFGSILFGNDPAVTTAEAPDVRDQNNGDQASVINHYVLVENLIPQKKYYFKINSADIVFDNQGRPYEVTTAVTKTPIDSDIAQGRILNPDGSSTNGALVFLNLANASPQVALTDQQGRWMVPLSTARSVDLSDIANYDRSSQILELLVVDGPQSASATLSTRNDNPTPDITLGQTYNFTAPPRAANPTPMAVGQEQTNFSDLSNPASQELNISYPSNEEKLTEPVPEFFGTGPAGEKIDIEIHSDTMVKETALVDSQGAWKWSPSEPLTPGSHTITISYTDKDGFVKKSSRTFVVLAASAAENQYLPSFTATGSGQITTPYPTTTPSSGIGVLPTSTPIPTPTTGEAASPTAGTEPTPTSLASSLTPTTTVEPTPTETERVSIPEKSQEVPTSGNAGVTLIFAGIGLVVIVGGVIISLL